MLVKTEVFADHVQVALMRVDVGWSTDFHQVRKLTFQQVFAHLPDEIFHDLRDLVLCIRQDDSTFRLALVKPTARVFRTVLLICLDHFSLLISSLLPDNSN